MSESVPARPLRLSQAVAAIVAAVIISIGSLIAAVVSSRHQSAEMRDDFRDLRRELATQKDQIVQLQASIRDRDQTIKDLRRGSGEAATTASQPRSEAQLTASAAPSPAERPRMGPTSMTPPVARETITSAPSSEAAAADGFEFTKPICSRRADQLVCEFKITNVAAGSQPMKVMIVDMLNRPGYSSVIDSNGQRYFAVSGEIGGVEQDGWRREALMPLTPIAASVTFRVPTSVRPPVTLALRISAKRDSMVNFTNIEVH